MSFLLQVLNQRSTPNEIETALSNYRSYIESIRSSLPTSAFDFAVASWHYDYKDHRCPHDSWLESLVISEPSSGTRRETREIAIEMRLLGAYHDGYLRLSYCGVCSYSLSGERTHSKLGHGDWLTDEIRRSDRGLVLHEILFRTGNRWTLESADIVCRWEPIIAKPSV